MWAVGNGGSDRTRTSTSTCRVPRHHSLVKQDGPPDRIEQINRARPLAARPDLRDHASRISISETESDPTPRDILIMYG